jgi:Protein kinase domain/AAA ATPase domain
MTALAAGCVVAGYRVEGLLGRGGMGAVYRAQAPEVGARVALKVIADELADDPQFRARFHREAVAAASFEHPHVVSVLEAGEHQGLLYLAMQLIAGVDLATLIDRERLLPAELAVGLVSQVASALDAAHAIGLVHRDVKPANILVAKSSRTPETHAYLTDFGVARRLQERTRLTRPGFAVGTVDYLAPEALRGEGAGPAVDIYALGCVLFECLTGTPPFARDEEIATVLAHLEEPPPPLASRAPGVSAALERAVHRALAKLPDDRFASASALARAARAGLTAHDPGPAGPQTSRPGAARSPTAPLPGAPPPAPPREPVPTRKRVTLLYAVPELAPGLDPELRAVAATEFEQLARPVLERHGATIDSSPTGGLIGLFGLPVAREDDAGRAVRAALALQAEVGTATGSEAGPVVVVATDVVIAGGDTPSSTTLSGIFELAFSMRQAAVSGDVHVSAATRELAGGVAHYEPLADQPAVWRALPMHASQIVAASGRATLVGRQAELDALERALAEVEDEQSSRLVSIVGDPGIGKSRLLAEFVSRARASATVTTARCQARGEADAQEPLRELVSELVDGVSPGDLIRGDDADAILERIERLLGRRDGDVPADELPWVVRRLLESAGHARPIVAVLEDIHWAHDPLLELLEYVAEWTSETPLLVLCLARPELLEHRPDWGEDAPGSRRIKLQALRGDDCDALLDGLPTGRELSPELRTRILDAAEGNPLFLEQMVALVRDRPSAGDAITVPPNVEALLAARIDRLASSRRMHSMRFRAEANT